MLQQTSSNKSRLVHVMFCAIVMLVSLTLPCFSQNYGQIPAVAQAEPVALIGATVHPVNAAPIEKATVVFDNGKIIALGQNVAVPANAKRIDAKGKHVYPSLIAAYTTLGLIEIGAVRATDDMSETGPINPNVRAEVAVNPDGEMIPVTRSNGVALAVSVPQGGIISGTSALLMLDGWTWEQMTMKAPLGLHVNWPNMTLRRGGFGRQQSEEEQRKEMAENLKQLKDAFAAARAYMKAKEAEAQKGMAYHKTDARWEAMIAVLKREIPVFVSANEVKQIQAAVQWAEDEGLRLVIVGGRDSWRVARLLHEKNVAVVYGQVHDLPSRAWEAYDTPFTTPKKLHEAGVKFCLANFENSNVRNLPYEAATASAYGLPKEEALKSITLYAAEILGVSDRVGSLEVGKDATLFITTGDPLEITTQVERVFIQGRDIDLGDKHKALHRKYSEKYRQLQNVNSGAKPAGTN
ncbi:amidohydrolase family protein [candidate division KSB1 bacterium]|nr:amidohydrolase family protein [candidate division KSB1 bacterium]